MWVKKGKKLGGLCLSPCTIRIAGIVLIGTGALFILLFVPLRYWMALLGVILLGSGIALRVLF